MHRRVRLLATDVERKVLIQIYPCFYQWFIHCKRKKPSSVKRVLINLNVKYRAGLYDSIFFTEIACKKKNNIEINIQMSGFFFQIPSKSEL